MTPIRALEVCVRAVREEHSTAAARAVGGEEEGGNGDFTLYNPIMSVDTSVSPDQSGVN